MKDEIGLAQSARDHSGLDPESSKEFQNKNKTKDDSQELSKKEQDSRFLGYFNNINNNHVLSNTNTKKIHHSSFIIHNS